MSASTPSPNPLTQRRWNPYVTGVGIGVLSWIVFLTMDHALGTSSSFVHWTALAASVVDPGVLKDNAYLAKEINEKTPMFDWQVFLVIGVMLGAFVSSRISGDTSTEKVPPLWAWRFGDRVPVRYAAAFLGGAIMLFGARLAGGCTSGHAISGGLQLALSSWTFLIAMFASGIATAFALFGWEGRRHVHG